jgi:hypothetical protein
MEELDVMKMVWCPDQDELVDCEDCIGCDYYHGMGDLDFTLKCGFVDENEDEE